MDGCMDDVQKLSQCSLPQPSQGSYDSFSLGTHLPFRETVLFNFNFLGLFYNYSLLGEEHRPDYRCRFIVQQILLYPHHILSPVIVKKNLPWALYICLKWIKEWVMCDPYVRATSECIYNSLLNAPCILFITQIHPPPTTKVFSRILSVGKAVFVWRNHYRWESRLRTDLLPHLPQPFRHVPASDNYNV